MSALNGNIFSVRPIVLVASLYYYIYIYIYIYKYIIKCLWLGSLSKFIGRITQRGEALDEVRLTKRSRPKQFRRVLY